MTFLIKIQLLNWQQNVYQSTSCPQNWASDFTSHTNKLQSQVAITFEKHKLAEECFSLSAALVEWFDQEDKQLIITDGEAVLSEPLLPDLTSLTSCNHEEADSRMLLNASHAAKHGHHAILIRTVDTDVVVLAVSLAQELQPEDKLAFGTGQTFRYLAAHEIAAGLGREKARY